ncbi:acyl-CoA dehydrogenase family protein [Nonomuraea purpurea]|uniref:Acyl-CoA dehydrogenase family protein n=1 Tax=Nonomuraea purpurea TaxID=1849276 RepID=A0ABV8G3R7_9ACTN
MELPERFRDEVRAWLRDNWTPGLEREEWNARLYEAGWICASWPVEYGGRGLTTLESVALAEEFARAGAPMRADWFGDTLVGPTILRWGTEEQKEFFIPKILRGEITWCQGFSEPEAGSDLASLRTRAVADGDEWVIDGHKIWTTRAQDADYVFLLARTDPDAPKHRGISYLLVPMRQNGVEVRPIEQLDGAGDFCEVFFTGARTRREWVVGGVNNGWKVAMTTLGFERGTSATTGHRRFEKELAQIIELARSTGTSGDPLVRQRLARQWSKIQIMRFNGLRTLSDTLRGTKDAAALGPLAKIWWSETHRETMDLAMDILGPDGQILTGQAAAAEWVPGYGMRHGREDYPASVLQRAFLFSPSDTIGGGTAEIQRNIVAERVLGLPRS